MVGEREREDQFLVDKRGEGGTPTPEEGMRIFCLGSEGCYRVVNCNGKR